MNCRPAAICIGFDEETSSNVAAAASDLYRPTVDVDDGDDDSADDDVVGPLTQQLGSSASPVDLLRALPASCAMAMSADDATSPPPTSTRTLMLSPRLACCRTCDVQRRWNTRIATVPVAGDAACTCAGWVSAKPTQHSPSAHLPAPPPVPRRSRALSADRRRRINDTYSTCNSDNIDVADVELGPSLPSRHLDCFRFCCFGSSHSSEPEQQTMSRRMTETTDVVGLTTVCRCSAVFDTGNGNRNSHHDRLMYKHTRGSRRRYMTHVLIACIVALPVTCLVLLGLCLVIWPLYHSSAGTSSSLTTRIILTL